MRRLCAYPGCSSPRSQARDQQEGSHANAPKVDANPGDVVLVKSEHFLGGDVGAGSSKRRIHPAVVVQHDPDTHIVHVAPIGHEHPGGVPTMLSHEIGIPPTDHRPSLVGLGTPKMIHQDNLKPLGKARDGSVEMPKKISAEHFDHLTEQLAAHAPPPPAPKSEKKEKKKEKINKRDLERRSSYVEGDDIKKY